MVRKMFFVALLVLTIIGPSVPAQPISSGESVILSTTIGAMVVSKGNVRINEFNFVLRDVIAPNLISLYDKQLGATALFDFQDEHVLVLLIYSGGKHKDAIAYFSMDEPTPERKSKYATVRFSKRDTIISLLVGYPILSMF